MVTVTLPIRPGAAPQPDHKPPSSAVDAGATGFGAVFALLDPGSAAKDRAPPADPAPSPESWPDRGLPDVVEESIGDVPQAPDKHPVPPPGQMAPPPPQPGAQVNGPVASEAAGDAPDGLVEAVAPAPGPPPDAPPAPATGALPTTAGAIALPGFSDATPVTGSVVAASASVLVTASARAVGAIQEGATGAASGAADAAGGMPPETGLFILAEQPGPALRAPTLPVGMPAFWAAREAAATVPLEGAVPTEGAADAMEPEAARPVPPVPVEAFATASDSMPDDNGGMTAPQEMRAAAAPQTLAVPASPTPQGHATAQSTTPAAIPPHLPAQIAAVIAARPERPLELRLAPVELGGLTLNLRQDGEVLRVVLQADRPDTLDLLRRNGDVLLEELRLAGFAGASLSFGNGGGAQDRQAPATPQAAPAADSSALSAPGPARAFLPSAQGLDLRL